jgi:hypothetical protein
MPNIETKIVSTGKDGAVRLFTPDEALKFANQALRGKEPKEAVNNG